MISLFKALHFLLAHHKISDFDVTNTMMRLQNLSREKIYENNDLRVFIFKNFP